VRPAATLADAALTVIEESVGATGGGDEPPDDVLPDDEPPPQAAMTPVMAKSKKAAIDLVAGKDRREKLTAENEIMSNFQSDG
jgi:hypothetical protein